MVTSHFSFAVQSGQEVLVHETVPSVSYLFYIYEHLFREIKVLQTVRIIHGFSMTEKIAWKYIFERHRHCCVFGLVVALKQVLNPACGLSIEVLKIHESIKAEWSVRSGTLVRRGTYGNVPVSLRLQAVPAG
jgi:hypothetical protein